MSMGLFSVYIVVSIDLNAAFILVFCIFLAKFLTVCRNFEFILLIPFPIRVQLFVYPTFYLTVANYWRKKKYNYSIFLLNICVLSNLRLWCGHCDNQFFAGLYCNSASGMGWWWRKFLCAMCKCWRFRLCYEVRVHVVILPFIWLVG